MPVDRPTFSESWHRVASLRPRLRAGAQVHRQHFRGRMWHVLQDPASNDYFRLSESAYHFVALLDGRRTVRDAWRICEDQLGDAAPTQGEAIQLLGQLYTSNLLMAELAPDAEGLLKRYRKRRAREVQGYLTSLLFARIPLIDPDRFLERWVGVFGRAFTWPGLIVWLALLATAGYFLAGRTGELVGRTDSLFAAANLPLLYAALVVTKVCHEFGHGFAVKRFGRVTGTSGEVHTMGVMLLVFMPLPYVDASSAWAFRRKRHRVVVGAAGMLVELAIAATAAIVWAHTGHSALRGVCYNIMFIASVSTLLFNGNPLLRYDAYYILSDLLEIPNLAPRSRQYLMYLVRRYVYGAKRLQNPAHTAGERAWFVFYGIASTVYRTFIFAMILLFVTDRLPRQFALVAAACAVLAAFMWLCVPLGKFVKYLATSQELARTRPRAVAITSAVILALVAAVGAIPAPDRVKVEGVVEPVDLTEIHAREGGFVEGWVGEPGRVPEGAVLAELREDQFDIDLARLQGRLAELKRKRSAARAPGTGDTAALPVIEDYIAQTREEIARLQRRKADLRVTAPGDGLWVPERREGMVGRYAEPGEKLGRFVGLSDVRVLAVVDQADKRLLDDAGDRVEIRVRGRPEVHTYGRRTQTLPVGTRKLPSAALGYAAGGTIATDPEDREGTRAAEPVFQVRVRPEGRAELRPGQRVVLRFETGRKPLAVQWWHSLRRLVQRRFKI